MSIKKLPDHVINHIAAGEVIDRPASIVKELVENSLDAQASRIEVELKQGGLESICVTDNGTGISHQDIPLVFERHATSKLRTLDDLLQLCTFGFRGEALFSIMSSGNVTLKTRHIQETEGTHVQTFGGKIEFVQPIGYRQGNSIIVEGIFDRFPVRKHRLQKTKELWHILRFIEHFALAHPSIGFVLKNDRKTIQSFFELEQIEERIERIWKLSPNQLTTITSQSTLGKLKVSISKPEFFSTTAQQQVIMINQRLVHAPHLQKSIYQSLKTYFHKGMHPQFVLSLSLSPHLIDINIHPQKKEIKYLQENEISSFIAESITNAFAQLSATEIRYTAKHIFPKITSVKESVVVYDQPEILSVQQLNKTYILATLSNGLLLLDQHAADERLWYNRLLKDQELLRCITPELPQSCLEELADDIYQHSFEPNINSRIATIACHQAIRAGEALSPTQMSTLVSTILQGGNETLVCPHGRPTHMFVSLSQLQRAFRR